MSLTITAHGREIPVETRKARVLTSPRIAAEALFRRPVTAQKQALPALDDVALTAPPRMPDVDTVRPETEHEKCFRLVGELKFEEAARIAARLINANNDDRFFIYSGTPDYRRAEAWFQEMVQTAKRSASTTIHNISPELSQILLLNNEGNRRVKAPNLARIMRDIVSGRFELNGESMVVSKEGKPNDGQHRNFAVLLTGRHIKTVISFGFTRDSMRTIDIGEKRQAKDRLGIAGVSDYIRLSAVAAFAFQTYNGRAATPAEADDYFYEHRSLIERASSVAGSPPKGVGPAALSVAAMHLLSIGAEEEDIKTFFKGVRTGANLSARSPIKKLHDGIFKAGSQIKLSRESWLHALVYHFVVWKRGRPLASVVFNQPLPKEL